MPEIVKVKSSSSANIEVFLGNQCSGLIAAVMCKWAHLEQRLASMFAASMGAHEWSEDGHTVSVNQNWIAKTALQEINSIHGKLKVVHKSITPFLTDELLTKWQGLKKRLVDVPKKEI